MNEIHAARIFDKLTIQVNGIRAKTNFSYTKKQLEKMLQNEDDVPESDIEVWFSHWVGTKGNILKLTEEFQKNIN